MGKTNALSKKLKRKRSGKVVAQKDGGKEKAPRKPVKDVKKGNTENKYSAMSFDDFISEGLEADSDESDSCSDLETTQDSSKLNGSLNDENEDRFADENDVDNSDEDENDEEATEHSRADGDEEESNESAADADSDEDGNEIESHKKSLEKLKETDPEFYKFLQENDKKLLQFGKSDSEDDTGEEDEGNERSVHVPNENLEVASDESDFEPEGDEEKKPSDGSAVTLKMLKTWQNDIRTDKTNKTIACIIRAFHAALCRVSNVEDKELSHYTVEGSAVFNGVIQLSVLELGPAVRNYLGLQQGSKQPPHKCKKFVKVKGLLRSYFNDLLKLLGSVTSSNILTVLLKHLHYMCPLIVSFSNTIKPLLKRLVNLWSTSDEAVRVVAFLCILRITSNQMVSHLDSVLKMMYMAYVKNSKFVSPNSLAGINFMRRSLVEMFALDLSVSYQHAFMYIRQLAIHLRNAITMKKKENTQIVYNWQFVNSLRLWSNLLEVTCNRPQLQPLIYPFVQVCIGTINLVPTSQYYPLRFHIVQILMDLSKGTGVFIPILPFLLDVLINHDFNRKHQKVSMKPLQFRCVLRLSKSQLSENGFKDAVIDMIYSQLLEYLALQSNSVAFPDLSLSAVLQIKQFIKKCSNQNYTKKMRQLVDKIQQNAQFIENERKNLTLNITDFKQIDGWQSQIRNKGTPLRAFHESWDKVRKIKTNKQATNNEEIGDYNLPVIRRAKKSDKKPADDKPVTLFPSDSESEDADKTTETSEKPKRGKRGGKKANKRKIVDHSGPVKDSGEKDVVVDLNISDW